MLENVETLHTVNIRSCHRT